MRPIRYFTDAAGGMYSGTYTSAPDGATEHETREAAEAAARAITGPRAPGELDVMLRALKRKSNLTQQDLEAARAELVAEQE